MNSILVAIAVSIYTHLYIVCGGKKKHSESARDFQPKESINCIPPHEITKIFNPKQMNEMKTLTKFNPIILKHYRNQSINLMIINNHFNSFANQL